VRSEGEVIEQSTVGHGLVLLHLVTAGTKDCSTNAQFKCLTVAIYLVSLPWQVKEQHLI